MLPTVHSVQLASGLRLQYVRQGQPGGIPLLLLHGFTDSWHSFEPVLPLLPPAFDVIAVTHRGHGDSDHPASGYRDADFAADAVGVLDALGIDRAVVVGHSLGAVIAQRIAIDYPDRVLAAVFVGGFGIPSQSAALAAFAAEVADLDDPIDLQYVREFQLSTTTRPLSPLLLDTFVAESLKVPARIWREVMAELVKTDLAPGLGRIVAPALIMWGDGDGVATRAEQDFTAREVPGARLNVYPGTGHAVHWDEPQHFVDDLVAFVEAVVPAGQVAG